MKSLGEVGRGEGRGERIGAEVVGVKMLATERGEE